MLEKKKVIIFDLDGTLIDSIGVWNEIDSKLINRIGSKPIDEADIGIQRDEKLKEFSKTEDAYLEYCGFLKEKYNSNMTKQEIKKLRYEIANEYLRNNIDYKPKAEELLKFLKDKGFILVIASTTNDHTIEIYKNENKNIKSKADFCKTFDLIYSKGAVKDLKPNPEIHIKVMNTLKVKPEECIVFEDSLIGVEAANSAGIDVAVIYDKYSDANRKEINQKATYIFNNFEEVLNYLKREK